MLNCANSYWIFTNVHFNFRRDFANFNLFCAILYWHAKEEELINPNIWGVKMSIRTCTSIILHFHSICTSDCFFCKILQIILYIIDWFMGRTPIGCTNCILTTTIHSHRSSNLHHVHRPKDYTSSGLQTTVNRKTPLQLARVAGASACISSHSCNVVGSHIPVEK